MKLSAEFKIAQQVAGNTGEPVEQIAKRELAREFAKGLVETIPMKVENLMTDSPQGEIKFSIELYAIEPSKVQELKATLETLVGNKEISQEQAQYIYELVIK